MTPFVMALMVVLLFALSAVMLMMDSGKNADYSSDSETTVPATTTTTAVPPQDVSLNVSVEMVPGGAVISASASVSPDGSIERIHCSMYSGDGDRLVYSSSVSGSDAVWEIDSHLGQQTIYVTALAAPSPDRDSIAVSTQEYPVTFEPGEFVWPVEPEYQMLLHDRYQVSSGSETVGGYTHNNGLMREKHYVYGDRRNHYGFDITADPGSEVVAAADGKVLGIYQDTDAIGSTGYGTYMILRHDAKHNDKTVYTLYAHLSKTLAQTGQQVSQGEAIALSGNTGGSRIPHLHLEFRLGANDKTACVDPLELLPRRDFSLLDSALEAKDGFSHSSIQLHDAMLRFGWDYAIPGRLLKDVSASGHTFAAGTEIEILSRSGNTVRCRAEGVDFSCKASSLEYTFDRQ